MRSNGVSINFKTHFSFVFSQNRRLHSRLASSGVTTPAVVSKIMGSDEQSSRNLTPVTNTRRVLKNPLTAPGGTVEVDRHRATKPSMSSN